MNSHHLPHSTKRHELMLAYLYQLFKINQGAPGQVSISNHIRNTRHVSLSTSPVPTSSLETHKKKNSQNRTQQPPYLITLVIHHKPCPGKWPQQNPPIPCPSGLQQREVSPAHEDHTWPITSWHFKTNIHLDPLPWQLFRTGWLKPHLITCSDTVSAFISFSACAVGSASYNPVATLNFP